MTMELKLDEMSCCAVKKCIETRIPFALYAFPGESALHFVACRHSQKVDASVFFDYSVAGSFAVTGFIPNEPVEVIAPELSPEAVMAMDFPVGDFAVAGNAASTSFAQYAASAEKVIAELHERGGKVVLSRIIVEEGFDPVTVALKYFSEFPDTFRSLFFTPSKGLWLGATPELLVDYSKAHKSLHTMSLAGTRPAGTVGEWDAKNTEEHNYVTAFIKDVLGKHAVEVKVSAPCALRYGAVEHLCERIEASGIGGIADIVSELSPTPAVCGTPRDYALDIISKSEPHSRGCYGGWIAVKSEDGVKVYVNLRCAAITPAQKKGVAPSYIYKVYAGGGFTADSSVPEEWNEASEKASALLKVIKNPD